MLNFTVPCTPLVKRDCEAIWVAIGECELDGSGQFMRYTIEQDAVAGGKPCPYEDGFAMQHPC